MQKLFMKRKYVISGRPTVYTGSNVLLCLACREVEKTYFVYKLYFGLRLVYREAKKPAERCKVEVLVMDAKAEHKKDAETAAAAIEKQFEEEESCVGAGGAGGLLQVQVTDVVGDNSPRIPRSPRLNRESQPVDSAAEVGFMSFVVFVIDCWDFSKYTYVPSVRIEK